MQDPSSLSFAVFSSRLESESFSDAVLVAISKQKCKVHRHEGDLCFGYEVCAFYVGDILCLKAESTFTFQFFSPLSSQRFTRSRHQTAFPSHARSPKTFQSIITRTNLTVINTINVLSTAWLRWPVPKTCTSIATSMSAVGPTK